jgi:Fur family ferric uptake transcriptional regulator
VSPHGKLRAGLAGKTMAQQNELRKAGLKVTLPRVKILEIIGKAKLRHMSAEDVYKALLAEGEEFPLATVYRVLTQFEAAGLVSRQNFEGGHAVFELDEGGHHDHLVCMSCGKVVEFMNDTIEQLQHDIAETNGFKLVDHSLTLYGECSDCKK